MRLLFGLGIAVAIVALAVPASAIRYGELDGDGHPHVGLMVAFNANGTPLWRCTGTLLSSRLFLTAGHCTEAPAATAQIFFDADVQSLSRPHPYPFDGDASGVVYTHPDYDPNAFFVHDLGVVVLDAPYVLDEYGVLPELDQLDAMDRARRNTGTTFTAVGYGLQRIVGGANGRKPPSHVEGLLLREVSHPRLIQINRGIGGPNNGIVEDFALLLTNNAATGGTCFGDSGGPLFIGDSNVVGAVNSYVINYNCAGTAGVYRVDRADDLDWLADEFGAYLP